MQQHYWDNCATARAFRGIFLHLPELALAGREGEIGSPVDASEGFFKTCKNLKIKIETHIQFVITKSQK